MIIVVGAAVTLAAMALVTARQARAVPPVVERPTSSDDLGFVITNSEHVVLTNCTVVLVDRRPLRDWVAAFTYEGFTFAAPSATSLEVMLVGAPSAYPEGRWDSVDISVMFRTPEQPTREEFLDLVLEGIGIIEDHERLENAWLDGQHAFDPHPVKVRDLATGIRIMGEHRDRAAVKFGDWRTCADELAAAAAKRQ